MAIMIPSDGGTFNQASGEEKMFQALKMLPNDYFVFHSYRVVDLIPDYGLNENEIDFFIFHPDYGCLFLECKNGIVEKTEEGWQYVKNDGGTIVRMHMKDPFDQAFTGQHNLFNKLRERYPEHRAIIDKCKFMVAVWFPKLTKREIHDANFGPNVAKELILSKEAVYDPPETLAQIKTLMERMKRVHIVYEYTEKIIDDAPGYEHSLSRDDAMKLYTKVLCPTFRAVMHPEQDYEWTYRKLLEEQYVALEFLAFQRTAAISGASGTGKTMVAAERARRLSVLGQKVLFLCYNRNLRDWLDNSYHRSDDFINVDFYTLDAFACKKCGVSFNEVNYYDLQQKIEDEIVSNQFEYRHIIIDEGQDFGANRIEEAAILELFCQYGEGKFGDADTSFYIFYDKNQLVNSTRLPVYIENVDSKITLYKNCRNTKTIANSAHSLMPTRPVLSDMAWRGEPPTIYSYRRDEEFFKKIDKLISDLAKEQHSRVIISCARSLQNSIMASMLKNMQYRTASGIKTNVYTAATFKGLEADDVIVVDAEKIFQEKSCTFYVAAGRAKKRLCIFMNAEMVLQSDLEQFFDAYWNKPLGLGDPMRQIAAAMHCFLK